VPKNQFNDWDTRRAAEINRLGEVTFVLNQQDRKTEVKVKLGFLCADHHHLWQECQTCHAYHEIGVPGYEGVELPSLLDHTGAMCVRMTWSHMNLGFKCVELPSLCDSMTWSHMNACCHCLWQRKSHLEDFLAADILPPSRFGEKLRKAQYGLVATPLGLYGTKFRALKHLRISLSFQVPFKSLSFLGRWVVGGLSGANDLQIKGVQS
jgi:hypothetical protein